MSKSMNSIKSIIQEAQQLNDTKLAAITLLEGGLSNCPTQWLSAVKHYIKVVRANIEARQNLVKELLDKSILDNPQRLIDITYELQALDNKDVLASNMFEAIMNEED